MEVIKIPFSGITRNTDDGVCKDGECMELINARIMGGAIEPVSKPIKIASFSQKYDKIFFHSLANKYIGITEEGKLDAFDEQFKRLDQLSPDVSGVSKVEFIGRTLCALTDTGIKYFIFRNDTYTYIGDIPQYTFSVSASDEKDIEVKDKIYDCQFTDDVAGTLKIDYRDVDPFIDFLDSCKNEALAPYKDKARYADPICVRAALKMYDGSYVAHSPVYLIFPSNPLGAGAISGYYISKGSNTKFGAIKINSWILRTFLVKYNYSFNDSHNWRDLILSLDIFISRPFSLIDVEACKDKGISIANVPEQIRMEVYKQDGMMEKIMSVSSQMYFSVSADSESGYIQEAQASNSLLPDDAFTHNSLCAGVSYVYNGRLHLGSIKNILFGGFLTELSIPLDVTSFNGNVVEITGALYKSFTYITTEYGEKIAYKQAAGFHPLPPIFCYPDYRATKVVIYAAIATSAQLTYKKRTLDLRGASGMNMAFYLGWNESLIYNGVSVIDMLNGITITEEEFNNPPISIDNIEHAPNKLKVSELNNPFLFPAKQTYTPSNGEIIALQSNTSALSQGQFGQYPLYVFCKDGINAMHVGTDGSVVYASSTPVSRDSCVNPHICGLDAAVAFLSDRGAMMITGPNVQCFSEVMDGFLPSCVMSSPIIPKIMNIANFQTALSSVTFKEYIQNAKMGYNYQQSEIIIANSDYPYSYVYGMKSGRWHKIFMQITSFVNVYPETYAIVQKGTSCILFDLNNTHRSVSTIALLTRPIKLGTNSYKRILQTALRGIVKRALSDLYLRGEPVMFREEGIDMFSDVGFYILGTNDTEHFSLISGKESIVDMRDLVTKMNKSKAYKYFMIALIGGVRSDVVINYIEMTANKSFENRLR